jgi:hypothetical protein
MAEQFGLDLAPELVDRLPDIFPQGVWPRHQGPGQTGGEILQPETGGADGGGVPALLDVPGAGAGGGVT